MVVDPEEDDPEVVDPEEDVTTISTTDDDSDEKSKLGLILGITFGVLIITAAIGIIFLCCKRKNAGKV